MRDTDVLGYMERLGFTGIREYSAKHMEQNNMATITEKVEGGAYPPARPPVSLVKKLAAVSATLGYVPKNGYNAHHKYHYVTEADLVSAVREKLAERNVFVFPKFKLLSKVGDIATVEATFTFVDGDSGETYEAVSLGEGQDKSDKGVFKAMTGATKYALMKTFLMPTGDDPELEDEPKKGGVPPGVKTPVTTANKEVVAAVVVAINQSLAKVTTRAQLEELNKPIAALSAEDKEKVRAAYKEALARVTA